MSTVCATSSTTHAIPFHRCQPLTRSSAISSRTGMRARSRSWTSASSAPTMPVTRPRLVSRPAASWTSEIPPCRHQSPTTTTTFAPTSTSRSHAVTRRRRRRGSRAAAVGSPAATADGTVVALPAPRSGPRQRPGRAPGGAVLDQPREAAVAGLLPLRAHDPVRRRAPVPRRLGGEVLPRRGVRAQAALALGVEGGRVALLVGGVAGPRLVRAANAARPAGRISPASRNSPTRRTLTMLQWLVRLRGVKRIM